MKKGNNNSPGPYLIEQWLKGLVKQGISVNKKVIDNNIKKRKITLKNQN